jgi:hypothetical protein
MVNGRLSIVDGRLPIVDGWLAMIGALMGGRIDNRQLTIDH